MDSIPSLPLMTPPPEELDCSRLQVSTLALKPTSPPNGEPTAPPNGESAAPPNGEPTTPESLPKTVASRCQSSTASSRSPSGNRRRSTASDLVFSTRNYEELYTESAYLNSTLHRQSGRLHDLFRQYASVEAQLDSSDAPPAGRRRLKKRRSLLKSKLDDAANQERALLNRLSELGVELKNRHAWDQAQREMAHQQRSVSLDTGPSYFCLSPTSIHPTSIQTKPLSPETPLNGASAEFVPGGILADPVDSNPNPPLDESSSLGTVDEEEEDLLRNNDLEYTFVCDGDMFEKKSQRRSSFDSETMSPRGRRSSLPNL